MTADDATAATRRMEGSSGRLGWQQLRWLVALLAVGKGAALALSLTGHGVATASSALAADPSPASSLAIVKPRTAEISSGAGKREGGNSEPAAAGGDVKSLLESLSRRQAELDQREKTVAAREEKLALYEKDVSAKIAQLEQVGKTLKEELKLSNSASDEAAASLAKVYGAMKPSEAAPILDQLDESTALRILTRMKEKQVGEILPLMTRERAIGLTRSLASRTMPSTDAASRPRS